jgi:hypothetical protein
MNIPYTEQLGQLFTEINFFITKKNNVGKNYFFIVIIYWDQLTGLLHEGALQLMGEFWPSEFPRLRVQESYK